MTNIEIEDGVVLLNDLGEIGGRCNDDNPASRDPMPG